MAKRMTLTQAQENVRKMLEDVVIDGVTFTVRDRDVPVAVVVPYEKYQAMSNLVSFVTRGQEN